MRLAAIIALLFLVSGALHAATALSSCALINTPGEYVLTNSVNGSPYSNTCIRITASDVDFDCAGFQIANGTFGVYIGTFNHNVTVRNCAISNYSWCMDIGNGVRNTTVSGNNFTICSTTMQATGNPTNETYYIKNLSVTNNRFINPGSHAISCNYMNDSAISDNYFYNLSSYSNVAIYFNSNCQNNTVSYNELAGTGSGFAAGSLNSGHNIIENNHFHDFLCSYGIDVYSSNNIIRGNNLSNCTYGGSSYGIYLYNWASNNSVYNNTIYRFNYGVFAQVASPYTNNSISNNTIWNMTVSGTGIYLTGTGNNTQVRNNTIYEAYRCIQLNQGDAHVVADNTLYKCRENGIDINGSTTNAAISGNEIYDSKYGLYFSGTQSNHTINGNEVHGNQKGVYVNTANAHNLTDTHLYNNSQDIEIYGGSIGGYYYNVSLANTIIDNPLGNYQDFTNLTLQDRTNVSTSIYVNWTNGTAAPSGNVSFANKWVNISKSGSGNASLDALVWHWRADEAGAEEGSFALYSYNSSAWALQNGTPNTIGHTLSLFNHVPASYYGILQAKKEYLWLNSSGTYTLTSDMVGPGGAVSGVAGISSAVIIIDSDDVVFDCGGYSITNDATPDAVAILVNGSAGQQYTNITIRNCPSVSGYEYGAYVIYGNSVDMTGLNISGNDNGVRIEDSSQVFVGDSNVSVSTNNGVDIGGGCSDVTVDNTQVFDNGGDGVSDGGATGTTVNGCEIFGNGDDGVDTTGTSGAAINASDIWGNGDDGVGSTGDNGMSIENTNIFNNTDDGVSTTTSASTAMDANDIFGNGGDGWHDDGSTAPTCDESDIYDNGESGAELVGTGGATMNANDIFGNGGDGATLDGTTGAVFDGNNATGNGGDGVHVDGGQDNTFSNQRSESNGGSGASVSESSGTVLDPSWFCNNAIGVLINASNDTLLDDSVACNNTQYGIYALDSDNVTINRSRTYNNSKDFRVENNLGSATALTITSLTFDNPAGNNQNKTEIYLTDSVGASTVYEMEWAAEPAAPDAGLISFEGKYLDISGTGPIDSIAWAWTDAESVYRGYDESNLQLWVYTTSWAQLAAAVLDTGANTLTYANLNPASEYGILHNGSVGVPATLYGANLTNVTDLARYNGTAAGNLTTEGGNISAANINATQLTDKWAAYFGDISGSILLTDAAGLNNVYSWVWGPSDGGVVCLSVNSSILSFNAYPALGSDIDSAWGFVPSQLDSGNQTFNATTCTLDIGGAIVNNASLADTGAAGGFQTCAIKTAATPSKQEMIFCVDIQDGGTAWNGGVADFEVIVPTDNAPSATETYYFYVNLN